MWAHGNTSNKKAVYLDDREIWYPGTSSQFYSNNSTTAFEEKNAENYVDEINYGMGPGTKVSDQQMQSALTEEDMEDDNHDLVYFNENDAFNNIDIIRMSNKSFTKELNIYNEVHKTRVQNILGLSQF